MAVADRDELWEGGVSEYIVETNHVHNNSSLAKRGEAIPGPYSSLTCFAGVRPGAVPERGEIGGHRHRRARRTFFRFHFHGQTRPHGTRGTHTDTAHTSQVTADGAGCVPVTRRGAGPSVAKWVASPDFLNSRSFPFVGEMANEDY